jgi:hypothetical protein
LGGKARRAINLPYRQINRDKREYIRCWPGGEGILAAALTYAGPNTETRKYRFQ